MNAKVNAKTITSIGNIANAYGNVVFANNNRDTLCLVVADFAPANDEEKVNCFIPFSIIKAVINSDVKISMFILAVAKELASKNKLSLRDVSESAYRSVLNKMRIKADFAYHKEGDAYGENENEKYTKNGYHLIPESIRFSFGEHRSAFDNNDVSHFISDASVVEDF